MKNNSDRFRCTVVGCNPKLYGKTSADEHKNSTGHRTAKWPVRSAEGERKARERNKNGYYDKYNVGSKSAVSRGLTGSRYLDLLDIKTTNNTVLWDDEDEDDSALFIDFETFDDPGF